MVQGEGGEYETANISANCSYFIANEDDDDDDEHDDFVLSYNIFILCLTEPGSGNKYKRRAVRDWKIPARSRLLLLSTDRSMKQIKARIQVSQDIT